MAIRSWRPVHTLLVGTILTFWTAAFACGDSFDRERETKAIRNGLDRMQIDGELRAKVGTFLKIATVAPSNLGLRGIHLQSEARGKALTLLGLPRIPLRPQASFEAIDRALANGTLDNASTDEAVRLRGEADRLWGEGRYEEAIGNLSKAMGHLGIDARRFRC